MRYIGRNTAEAALIKKIVKSGNEHIFYFWDKLNDKQKDDIIDQLSTIKLKKVTKYFKNMDTSSEGYDFSNIDQAEVIRIENWKQSHSVKEAGAAALRAGEVAYLTVAGGQASRLGYDLPKGCFKISPVKHKSLFEIFAQKIKYYSDYYNVKFNWYIMTSESNYAATRQFFIENNYFGLSEKNVVFFKQGMLPTLDENGKLILKEKDTLFMNPDGHGGILNALLNIGLIDDMISKGIKYLSYFQVDNPLVNMADPYFIGYHIQNESQVTTKVISKNYPEEKLGSVVRVKNLYNKIIEYSDMTPEAMNEKTEDGKLKYDMGSIGIHIFSTDFIKKSTRKLPIHVAKKNISGYRFDLTPPQCAEMPGIKFETFVFDTIPVARRSFFFETSRDEEFYPLKNSVGNDSIETCILGQNNLYKSWLADAGISLDKNVMCEISPAFAPDREHFLSRAKDKITYIKSLIYKKNGGTKNEIFIE